jgi:hypothetical protein
MTNLLLLFILAVLLFGASAVTGFVGGLVAVVLTILAIVLVLGGIGWFSSQWQTNKELREGAWLFAWLLIAWYLLKNATAIVAGTFMLASTLIYLIYLLKEDVKRNSVKGVIGKYATFGVALVSAVVFYTLKWTLIFAGVLVVLGILSAIYMFLTNR